MSESEVKTFNVKNTSLRLVGFAGANIPPEGVIRVIDDQLGINRSTVEKDLFLDFTDDEPNIETAFDITSKVSENTQTVFVNPAETPAKATVKSGGKTATGAGWGSKKESK